jgi:hypothetical protein
MAERERANAAAAATALRIAGASYSEIAEAVGFSSPEAAMDAVERDLAFRATAASDDKKELVREESAARIERLLRSTWRKALDEQNPEHLPAVRTALSLIDRLARLRGADAPQVVSITTPTEMELDRWVRSVIAQQAMPDIIEGEVISLGEGSHGRELTA